MQKTLADLLGRTESRSTKPSTARPDLRPETETDGLIGELRLPHDEGVRWDAIRLLGDMLEAHQLEIGFLACVVRGLIDSILTDWDIHRRSELFILLERVLLPSNSEGIDLGRLVDKFVDEEPVLIASNLVLLPLARMKGAANLARSYLDHPDSFVRRNADYALGHPT